MSLDTVLAGFTELGITLSLGDDGRPRARGPGGEMTGAVKEALAAYREEILERLRLSVPQAPPAPVPPPEPRGSPAARRIVALDAGADGPAGEVLAEPAPGKESEELQRLMPLHPGRLLAAEWRKERHDGPEWVRFLRGRKP